MEKVKVHIIFLAQRVYLEFIFTEMFIELSSMFRMVFAQITEFDWLSGRQKG